MGVKAAQGDKKKVNKILLLSAITQARAAYLQSAEQIATLRAAVKALDEECLDGERAEAYRGTLDEVTAIADRFARANENINRGTQMLCDDIITNIDVAKVDAKLQATMEKNKSMRAKKLKGQ